MRRLLIQPQARLDLPEVWHHIAKDSVRTANRVGEKFEATLRTLTEMPGIGHRRADVQNKSYRFGVSILSSSPIDSMTSP